MSFRELRSFTETMKALGYPGLISMENFRTPNFELVADCLYWLVQRYHPGCDISDDISTENDRVKFLQSVAQIMLTKARMKLNIKRLYSADGLAVKEMLKLASLLYKATQKAATEDEETHDVVDFSATLKGLNLKEVKQCATEIIRSGAALYDALSQEAELREHRARAVAGHVDSDFVERSVHEAIQQVEDHVRSLEQQLSDLMQQEQSLDAKIEKRKQQLEWSEKRLNTMQSVRPAYMDEYEQLQSELQGLYQQYLDRYRSLEYLEHELEQYKIAEQESLEESDRRLKKMQKRLVEQELRILRGEQEVDETQLLDESEVEEDGDDDDLGDFSDDEVEMGDQRLTAKNTMKRGSSLGPAITKAQPRGQDTQVKGSLMADAGFDDDDEDASIDNASDDDGHISHGDSDGEPLDDDEEDEDLIDDDDGGDDESEDNDF